MVERPHSRYTREKTWAALYSQHINAGYALVPLSLTNNSIDVINCKEPMKTDKDGKVIESNQDLAKDTQAMTALLLQHADAIAKYYQLRQPIDRSHDGQQANQEKPKLPTSPKILADAIQAKKLRSAIVLARSSDYYRYHIEDYPEFTLVICGQHDSYLHLRVWEMRTNHRYRARETAVSIKDPDFDRMRRTPFGHNILLAAYAEGDPDAIAFVEALPDRSRTRYRRERDAFQDQTYRGRPLAFLNEAKRQEIGGKISESLKRYHANKYLHLIQGGENHERIS